MCDSKKAFLISKAVTDPSDQAISTNPDRDRETSDDRLNVLIIRIAARQIMSLLRKCSVDTRPSQDICKRWDNKKHGALFSHCGQQNAAFHLCSLLICRHDIVRTQNDPYHGIAVVGDSGICM